jgi:hypothetical protein
VFSKILVISAAWVEETGTTWEMICSYKAWPTSRQAGVSPPQTLGMFWVEYVALFGSSRSGE